MHAVQEGDSELPVHDRVVPGGLPVHVQGQVLPRPFPLIKAGRPAVGSGFIIVPGLFNSLRICFHNRLMKMSVHVNTSSELFFLLFSE